MRYRRYITNRYKRYIYPAIISNTTIAGLLLASIQMTEIATSMSLWID